jgi:SAM-dependent methyltransferase
MNLSRPPESRFKSYASLKSGGLATTVSEFMQLYRHKTADIAGSVASVVKSCEAMERLFSETAGLPLRDLDVLEVGAGQQLLRTKYFSGNNRVVALDYDITVQGFDPAGYWRLLRNNGAKRTLKTILRKASGIDRAYWRELEKRTGRVADRQNVVEGDAHRMPWPDASFDFVYSFSVFEHLRGPAICLDEVIRVLRPGGMYCISTHIYTSDSGAHDPRSFLPYHHDLAPWAHLRQQHRDAVNPNAYCNGWRKAEWEQLFSSRCPGVVLRTDPSEEWLRQELVSLRSSGELSDFSDEELLTTNVWAIWRKP